MRKGPVILIADSSSGSGGSAKYLSDLLSSLKKRDFAIEVLVYRKGPFFDGIAEAGTPVSYVRCLRYPWFERRMNIPYLLKALLTAIQFLVAVPWISFFLLRRRVSIVHLNNEISSHVPLILASSIMRRRTICHLHGWRRLTRLEKAVAGLVNLYVGITQRGTQFYKQQFPEGRYVTVLNGIRFDPKETLERRAAVRKTLGLSEDTICLGMVGRLIPWKGQDVFLQSFRELSERDPRVQALIVGGDDGFNGSYLKELEEEMSHWGIRDRVHFTGWQKSVGLYLAAMDIVVHASVEPEAFGLVIAEAMVQEKPVVATDGGGVPQLVEDHVTGLLVKPNDPQELSRALQELIQKPRLARQIGEAGREYVLTHFDIERNSRKMARLYDALLGRTKLLQGNPSEDR